MNVSICGVTGQNLIGLGAEVPLFHAEHGARTEWRALKYKTRGLQIVLRVLFEERSGTSSPTSRI